MLLPALTDLLRLARFNREQSTTSLTQPQQTIFKPRRCQLCDNSVFKYLIIKISEMLLMLRRDIVIV